MLNRFLFFMAATVALALVILVVLAPPIVQDYLAEAPRWLLLFAQDAITRRAAVVCALGLFVTAMVFFRGGSPEDGVGKRNQPGPGNSVGA